MKREKRIVLWADDDWIYYSKKEIKENIILGKEFEVFHYTKDNCYEGKPRKVEIIIREI